MPKLKTQTNMNDETIIQWILQQLMN